MARIDLKTGVLLAIVAISLFTIVTAFDIGPFTTFSTVNNKLTAEAYFVPKFGYVECTPIIPNEEFGPWQIPKTENDWTCGGAATDFKYVKTCNAEIKANVRGLFGSHSLDAFVCDANDDCQEISASGFGVGNWVSIGRLNNGEYIKTKCKGLLCSSGDWELKMTDVDIYGLRYVYSDNLLAKKLGCSIADVPKSRIIDLSEADYSAAEDRGFLLFNQQLVWIGAAEQVRDSENIIKLDGREIYVVGKGQYYAISHKTLSGSKIVDTSKILTDNRLECRPESAGCNDDATLKEDFTNIGKDCSELIGVGPGYQPIDADTVCTTKCVDGAIVQDQCKEIPQCEEGEVLTTDYECFALDVGDPTKDLGDEFGSSIGLFDSMLRSLKDFIKDITGVDLNIDETKIILILIAILAIFFILFGRRTGPPGYIGRVPIMPNFGRTAAYYTPGFGPRGSFGGGYF